jgi:hypothetical protein
VARAAALSCVHAICRSTAGRHTNARGRLACRRSQTGRSSGAGVHIPARCLVVTARLAGACRNAGAGESAHRTRAGLSTAGGRAEAGVCTRAGLRLRTGRAGLACVEPIT